MKRLRRAVLLLTCVLAACFPSPAFAQEEEAVPLTGEKIYVYNWGEYIADGKDGSLDINTEFTRRTGIEVDYSTFDTNESLYSKLVSGGASYDVIIPSDYMVSKMINEGMLEKLDFSNIPNYQYIDEEYRNLSYDPTNEYSVPYTWGLVGIFYNKQYVTETVDSWDILWDEKYAGKSSSQKLAELREKMKANGCTIHVITTLDDIAWLFNIRGNDVEYNPVVLSYAVIGMEQAHLFANPVCLNDEIREKLSADGVKIHDYDEMISFVKGLSADEAVLLDPQKVNYAIDSSIQGKKVEKANPTQLAKAIKNPVELENIRNAHIKDGVAFTKFMYWLKTNVGKIPMTEISAADYLLACRAEQEGFIEPSFDTISAYKANAAMMHYSATKESDAVLQAEGMLLVDSGGQYYEGTTDITRTMVLGPITDEQKLHFTTVLRSNLNLANARFLHGCVGMNLDILARGPIWDLGLDYKCGTGHGIGYLLNVHEAPNGFRWKIVAERRDSAVLEEGMVTTDEPGIYIEGSHGIRIENELICRKGVKNSDGQFMYFEPVTYAPIDLDGVDPQYMTEKERQALNDYHAMVYGKLFPYLTDGEREWLKEYTRAI